MDIALWSWLKSIVENVYAVEVKTKEEKYLCYPCLDSEYIIFDSYSGYEYVEIKESNLQSIQILFTEGSPSGIQIESTVITFLYKK